MLAIVNMNLKNRNTLTFFNNKFCMRDSSLSFNKILYKNYNGLFQRPTQSIFSHFQILAVIEALNYLSLDFNFSWTLSIVITTSVIRLIQIPTYFLIKNINFKKIIPFKNFFSRWSHKLTTHGHYYMQKYREFAHYVNIQ
jgi:hypothetical protein